MQHRCLRLALFRRNWNSDGSDRPFYHIIPRDAGRDKLPKEHATEQGRAVPKLQRERTGWQQILPRLRPAVTKALFCLRALKCHSIEVLLRMRDQP
jgi:hypothetical protein